MSLRTQSLRRKLHPVALLALMCLSAQLHGFEQGSYYLFHVKEEGSQSSQQTEKNDRIQVARSLFKLAPAKSDAQLAAGTKKSEFETEVTSLHKKEEGASAGQVDSLKPKFETTSNESSFGEPSFGQSSFGEEESGTSGFFFSF